MTRGLETVPARSLSVATEKPAAASSNLVPMAAVEQLLRRCYGRRGWNCHPGLVKPPAFSHSPQRRASKLLGQPSREFDRSVFGPPRSPLSRAASELLRHSK